MKLGEWVKQYRTDKGMSMQDFADACGFSKAYVGVIEKGVNPRTNKPVSPSIDTFKKIANGTRIDINKLISSLDGDQQITISAAPAATREQKHMEQYNQLTDENKSKVDDFTEYQLTKQNEDFRQETSTA